MLCSEHAIGESTMTKKRKLSSLVFTGMLLLASATFVVADVICYQMTAQAIVKGGCTAEVDTSQPPTVFYCGGTCKVSTWWQCITNCQCNCVPYIVPGAAVYYQEKECPDIGAPPILSCTAGSCGDTTYYRTTTPFYSSCYCDD